MSLFVNFLNKRKQINQIFPLHFYQKKIFPVQHIYINPLSQETACVTQVNGKSLFRKNSANYTEVSHESFLGRENEVSMRYV